MSIEETLCPECNGKMVSRTGKFGVFWGCINFPNCKGTRDNQGRSKADREEWKRKQEEKDPDVEWPRNKEDKVRWNK